MTDMLYPDEIKARIIAALDIDGTHSWDDLTKRLHDGHAQMFWNEHGAWITEIRQTPKKDILHVWIVAGELPDVMSVQPQVIEFARKSGCVDITALARFGWKHVAKANGWSERAMLIRHPVVEDPFGGTRQ